MTDKHYWIKYDWDKSDMEILLRSQEMPIKENISKLPKLGIIIGCKSTPIAAGFLRAIEGDGKTAILDSLITHKDSDSRVRDYILNMLVQKLIELAKDHGITNILAFSTDKNTLLRAQRFGFVELPHQVISLSLS